jgi:hypothetical protein
MSKEETSLQSSPQLVFNEQQEGVAVVLSEKETVALYKKSQQCGHSFDTLQEVYRRGYLTWDLHLNETPEQVAFNRVNSFIAGGKAAEMDQDLMEKKRGLWDNIHAKRARIKAGSGEKMRKPGSKGAPTDAAIKASQTEAADPCWKGYKQVGTKMKKGRSVPNCVPTEAYTGAEKTTKNTDDPASRFVGTDALTDTYKNATPGQSVKKVVKEVVEENIYEMYNCGCKKCGEIEESGLRSKHKSPSGGLTQAGRNYYNRTAGANLKAPVTTKPSKLKKGSKAAKRRKSFCARMGGMKKRLTSAKTARDPDSRINKALRKWNC